MKEFQTFSEKLLRLDSAIHSAKVNDLSSTDFRYNTLTTIKVESLSLKSNEAPNIGSRHVDRSELPPNTPHNGMAMNFITINFPIVGNLTMFREGTSDIIQDSDNHLLVIGALLQFKYFTTQQIYGNDALTDQIKDLVDVYIKKIKDRIAELNIEIENFNSNTLVQEFARKSQIELSKRKLIDDTLNKFKF